MVTRLILMYNYGWSKFERLLAFTSSKAKCMFLSRPKETISKEFDSRDF